MEKGEGTEQGEGRSARRGQGEGHGEKRNHVEWKVRSSRQNTCGHVGPGETRYAAQSVPAAPFVSWGKHPAGRRNGGIVAPPSLVPAVRVKHTRCWITGYGTRINQHRILTQFLFNPVPQIITRHNTKIYTLVLLSYPPSPSSDTLSLHSQLTICYRHRTRSRDSVCPFFSFAHSQRWSNITCTCNCFLFIWKPVLTPTIQLEVGDDRLKKKRFMDPHGLEPPQNSQRPKLIRIIVSVMESVFMRVRVVKKMNKYDEANQVENNGE